MNKKLPLWILLLTCWCFCIITMLFGAEILRIRTSKRERNTYARSILAIASFPHLIKETFEALNHPSLLIMNNPYPGSANYSVKKNYVDSNYVLLSTYDAKKNRAAVKLLRLQDQKIIHQWMPNLDSLAKALGGKSQFWHDVNTNNLQIIHPLLLSDGSIIFHVSLSPLIKIDKNSKVVWSLPGVFHHSLELDAENNVWTPSSIQPSTFFPHLLPQLKDDLITEISLDGQIVSKKSVAQIMYDNGYRGLLFGVAYEKDLLHLNDIQPALTTTKYWNKGDLLISIRDKSTVFLYRPSTNKILWLKTGPWINQHDADFVDSTKIGVFGNDVIRNDVEGISTAVSIESFLHGTNEEYVYDFKNNTIETPYSEFFKKADVKTPTEGRSDILANGDIFVEETNNNRLLRGNKNEIVWQYVDRIDSKSNAALGWSRFITKEEFKKLKFINAN